MGTQKNRKSPRTHVSLVARYRSPTAFTYVREDCFDLSIGGMFIKSDAPAQAGTLLKLECEVDAGAAVIRGVARVVWLRELATEAHPAGMGVKFVKLDPGTRETIQALLQHIDGHEGSSADLRGSGVPPRPSAAPDAAPAPAMSRSAPAPAPAETPTSGAPAARQSAAPEAHASQTSDHSSVSRLSERAPEADASPHAPSPAENAAPSAQPAHASDSAAGPVVALHAPAAENTGASSAHPDAHPTTGQRSAQGLRERLRLVRQAHEEHVVHAHDAAPRAEETSSSAAPVATKPVSAARTSASPPGPSPEPTLESLALETPPVEPEPAETFTTGHAHGPSGSVRPAVADQAAPAAPRASAPRPTPASQADSAPFDWRPAAYLAVVAVVAMVLYATLSSPAPEPQPQTELTPPPPAEPAPPAPPPAAVTAAEATPVPPPPPPTPAPAPTEAPPPAPPPAVVVAPPPPLPPPPPVPQHHWLELTTDPPGALVTSQGRTRRAPLKVDLGTLNQAVEFSAQLPGYETATTAVDRSGFADFEGRMRQRIRLTLTAIPKPVPVVASAPVPKAKPTRAERAPTPSKPAETRPPAAAPVAVAETHAAPTAPAPTEAKPAAPPPPPVAVPTAAPAVEAQTPLDAAMACLAKGDNACAIKALEGNAKAPRETELLIETYRATGDSANATRLMQTYVQKFPNAKRAASYSELLGRQQAAPPATP